MQSYDLFLHNCNNFSNDFAMFLVGKQIPSHITSLPQTVLNTPFGQMLRPQIDSAMREITEVPVTPSAVPQSGAVKPTSNGVSRSTIGQQATNGSDKSVSVGRVHNVTRLQELVDLLASARKSCAVIFFTSSTCAPCKIVYPAYDDLALEAGSKAVLIKVDLNKSYEIGNKYKVRATPTFMTFLGSQKVDEWSGANEGQLRGNVRMLMQMAYPPHPHSELRLPNLQRPHQKYVIYTKMPPLDKLIAKLGSTGTDPSVLALKDFITLRASSPAASAPIPSLPEVGTFIRSSLDSKPSTSLFPLVDLLRLALVDPRVSGYFAEEQSHDTVLAILKHTMSLGEECPHTLRIVTLQMACNLFSSSLYLPQLLRNPELLTPLVYLVTSSLLDTTHAPIRVSAASLAFNVSAVNHQQRLEQKADLLPESAQVELAASFLEALEREKESVEVLRGITLALGLLAYGCTREGELNDLLGAMDAKNILGSKMKEVDKEQNLFKEVMRVVG